MNWTNNRFLATLLVTVAVCSFAWGQSTAPSIASASPSPQVGPIIRVIPEDQTRAVQSALSGYGYTIVVDGVYGPQTTGVVKSWQRSNGLVVDGIAGPITQASLGLSQAQRINNQIQVGPVNQSAYIPNYERWIKLAQCESGGNWSINTGNGYYGGLQFALSSWRAVGGTGYPHEHNAEEQMVRAEALLKIQGWRAWPGCSRKFGWI